MSTKIEKIKVLKFKSVENADIDLKGSSIIVTGANNSGKTSILRGLIDRINSKQPEIVVKKGESNGIYTMELTDGCKIVWEFTEKSEKLTYYTKDNLPIKSGVIGILQEKYFGKKQFDIEKFLNSTPKEQEKTLCSLIGLDFTDIDLRYKQAYALRTEKNAILKNLLATKKENPTKCEEPNIAKIESEIELENTKINDELAKIRKENTEKREKWHEENETNRIEVESLNKENKKKESNIIFCNQQLTELFGIEQVLTNYGFFNSDTSKKLYDFIQSLPQPEKEKIFAKLPEPEFKEETANYSELNTLKARLIQEREKARNYAIYEQNLIAYNEWVASGKKAREESNLADEKVKVIEKEKQELIATAIMPVGFEFSDNGLLYNGFLLDKQSQSTSALYIAGLKLAIQTLGDLQSIHFDASFLDKNSLKEVEVYANSIDLQLLIERPDFDCGDIQYQIISEI